MDRPQPTFAEWMGNTARLLGYRTDSQLAAAVGVQQSTITRWRQGMQPTVGHLVAISRLLQMRIEPLLVLSGHVPGDLIANSEPQEPVRECTPAERRIADCPEPLRGLLASYWRDRQHEEETRLAKLIGHLQDGDPQHDLSELGNALTSHLALHAGALMSLARTPQRKRPRRSGRSLDIRIGEDGDTQ